jgi:hypothetical protein
VPLGDAEPEGEGLADGELLPMPVGVADAEPLAVADAVPVAMREPEPEADGLADAVGEPLPEPGVVTRTTSRAISSSRDTENGLADEELADLPGNVKRVQIGFLDEVAAFEGDVHGGPRADARGRVRRTSEEADLHGARVYPDAILSFHDPRVAS